MRQLSYANAVDKLLECFPVLRKHYDQHSILWEDEYLPHVVYGVVFNPYVLSLLDAADQKHNADLERVFDFLEDMANSGDEELRNILAVTILERITATDDHLAKVREHAGKSTLSTLDELLVHWEKLKSSSNKR